MQAGAIVTESISRNDSTKKIVKTNMNESPMNPYLVISVKCKEWINHYQPSHFSLCVLILVNNNSTILISLQKVNACI